MAQIKPKIPKLDLRKQYKEFYLPSAKEVVLVDVPEFLFIVFDGTIQAGVRPGDSEAFREAMAAMYGVSYSLKFMSKLRPEDPIDFTVMAVEGLWSTESGAKFDFDWREPSLYTLLMMQPDHITRAMFDQAVADARAKRAPTRTWIESVSSVGMRAHRSKSCTSALTPMSPQLWTRWRRSPRSTAMSSTVVITRST